MDEPMGPLSAYGWQKCHGCEVTFTEGGDERHMPDCPGLCIRPMCEVHPKV